MKSKKLKPELTMIIDTREQHPYEFCRPHRRDVALAGTSREALEAGDYSVKVNGDLLPVRIERKSMSDYFGICSNRFGQRERFERELERLQWMTSYLVIEATAEQVRHGFERSQVSGEAALGSALHWSVVFGVMPIFAGTWRTGNRITQGLLEDFALHFSQELFAVNPVEGEQSQ